MFTSIAMDKLRIPASLAAYLALGGLVLGTGFAFGMFPAIFGGFARADRVNRIALELNQHVAQIAKDDNSHWANQTATALLRMDQARCAQAYLLKALSEVGSVDSTNVQYCTFSHLTWMLLQTASQSANGIVLTSADLPTSINSDVAFCTFRQCNGECYNGICYILAAADNNSFFGCTATRRGPGTTNAGLSIRGTDENLFWDFSVYGVHGIEILGTASGYLANPYANVFFCTDQQNNTLYPTLDANVICQYHDSANGWYTLRAFGVTGQTTIAAYSERGATESGPDLTMVRNHGSTANAVLEGANLTLGDAAAGTNSCLQHSGGQTEIWQYNAGAWKQIAWWDSGGTMHLPGGTTGTQTATFSASNKPGTTAQTAPAIWLPIYLNGVQYYIPAFSS